MKKVFFSADYTKERD